MFNIYTMTNCWEIPLELLYKLHRFFILITSESARDHDDQLIFLSKRFKNVFESSLFVFGESSCPIFAQINQLPESRGGG